MAIIRRTRRKLELVDGTPLVVQVPKRLHKALQVHAIEEDLTLAQLVREALQEHLERLKENK